MNKIELTYSPYKLKLKNPFVTAKEKFSVRKGIIIRLISSSGKFGIGDAAPLPLFGSETFDDALTKLKNLKLNFKIDINNIYEDSEQSLKELNNFPALRAGIEQAFLNLICSEKNISLNEMLNRKSRNSIAVNAVIGFMPPEECARKACALIDSGFNVLKVKLGRDKFQDDLKCLESIKKAVPGKTNIRIDVNGKWKLSEAKKNLKLLEQFNIEYAEQPVNLPDSFIKLSQETSIPLAADESIRSVKDAETFITKNAINVLVLKPMMLGGIIPTVKILDKATVGKIKPVISSSFESAIGRAAAIFSASLVNEGIAHGLATAEYFEKDLTKDPYPVKHGKISL